MTLRSKKYSPQMFGHVGTGDLLQRYRSQAIQVGQALAVANTGYKNEGKIVYERAKMGRYYAGLRLLNETENELHKRLGERRVSPEISNRASFIFLAQYRVESSCHRCHKKPMRGSGLNFWTKDLRDPFPLPLVMAWGGASIDKIRPILLDCVVLCRACAKRAGCALLSNGNVDLHTYDVEVTGNPTTGNPTHG